MDGRLSPLPPGTWAPDSRLPRSSYFVLDEDAVARWSCTYSAAINPGVVWILTALEALPSSRSIDDREAQPLKGAQHVHGPRPPR